MTTYDYYLKSIIRIRMHNVIYSHAHFGIYTNSLSLHFRYRGDAFKGYQNYWLPRNHAQNWCLGERHCTALTQTVSHFNAYTHFRLLSRKLNRMGKRKKKNLRGVLFIQQMKKFLKQLTVHKKYKQLPWLSVKSYVIHFL